MTLIERPTTHAKASKLHPPLIQEKEQEKQQEKEKEVEVHVGREREREAGYQY